MEERETNTRHDLLSELYYLIIKFIENGPCKETAEVLSKEVEKFQLLPKRYDWRGKQREQTFQQMDKYYQNINSDHLLSICTRLCSILERDIPASVPGLISLLGVSKQSVLREKKPETLRLPIRRYSARRRGLPLSDPADFKSTHHILNIIRGRENAGPIRRKQGAPSSLYSHMHLHNKTLGHLSAVYCLLFDQTGHFLFTGADDLLVKAWSAHTGRLLATMRGASAEITDMAVNVENTLLAAGSLDRVLRVWCLQTTAPVAVLLGHAGMITGVNFCPGAKGDFRYLASTSTDGSVAFWMYTHHPFGRKTVFQSKPVMYNEKMRPGPTQMICASFSPGGTFMAAGSADHHVRVYKMIGSDGPTRILEIGSHSDRVDSIQWANRGLRFVSGSKDGTAHVWKFYRQRWTSLLLEMTTKLPGTVLTEEEAKMKPKVSMVCWNRSDEFIVTAVHDATLKVWDSNTGKLMQVLKGHRDEVFVIEAHPYNSNLILSAGHDGQIFIWDLIKGVSLMLYQNTIDGQGHGSVFDAKWSPDGTMFAATDSHGHIFLFGFGCGNEKMKLLPTELFFHTDYRPLIHDASHGVLDEQTQVAPHLMPPPFLVDVDGSPYPPELQKLVPGRETCKEDQLVPNIVYGSEGEQEVIDSFPVSNIDQMIEALAQRQFGPSNSRSSNQGPSNPTPWASWRQDTEGVRLSSGDWQGRSGQTWKARTLLRPLQTSTLTETRSRIDALAAAELEEFDRQMSLTVEAPAKLENDKPKPKKKGRRAGTTYQTRASKETTKANEFENPENLNLSASTSTSSVSDSSAYSEEMGSASDSDSESYSDWIADHGVSLEPPKRSKRRPVPRKLSPSPTPPPARKKNKEQSEIAPSLSNIKEVPPEFQPTKWLSEVIPRKSPYYPQMGDEIMFFKQGYQLYLDAVKTKQAYKIVGRHGASFKLKIPEPVLVKVIGIKYEIRPPRLCCLRLAVLDDSSMLTGQFFNIKYHDMADVIDFLVLKQTYDIAIQRNWKISDKFRCMIEDAWWEGKIVERRPHNDDYPDSPFLCYMTRWDNGEDEPMSPWDMEPVNAERTPEETGGSVPVLPEETQAILYCPRSDEWPNSDRDGSCRRIASCIDKVMTLAIAEPFLAPVDLNLYPSYAVTVEYPIDLSTIKARLENRFYRRVTAVQFDVRYLATNAEKFNVRHSQIVKQARIVTDICLRIIKDRDETDVGAVYHQLMDTYHSSSSEGDQQSAGDEDQPGPSTSTNRRVRVVKPFKLVTNTDWRINCDNLINEMCSRPDSAPFRQPVDVLEHPDYLQIIDTPMDLGTVREELRAGNYNNPRDFYKDVRLIFANSKNYNTNKRSRIFSMTVRLSNMFEARMKQIMLEWKSTRRRMILQQVRARKQLLNNNRPGTSASQQQQQQQQQQNQHQTNVKQNMRVDDDEDGEDGEQGDEDSEDDHLYDHMKLSTLRNNYLKQNSKVNGHVSKPAIRLRLMTQNNNSSRVKKKSTDEDEDDDDDAGEKVEEHEESDNSSSSDDNSSEDSYKPNGNTNTTAKARTRNSGKQKVKYGRRYKEIDSEEEDNEEEDDDDETTTSSSESDKPVVKSRGRRRKRKKESEDDSSYSNEVNRTRGRRVRRRVNESSDSDEDEYDVGRSRRSTKRHATVSSDDDEDDSDDDVDQRPSVRLNVSSRGRVRKLTERAKALYRN